MGAGAGAQSSHLAPFDGASQGQTMAHVDDDFGVIEFAGGVAGAETTHHADPVPTHWQGREVGLSCAGGIAYVAFSTRAGAEVDRTIGATNAGAAVKVGFPLPAGETRMRIPKAAADPIYFVRESDTVGCKVFMRLLS